jgi:hypothetical protein
MENIACADTIEEFNIAVGCYQNQNTMGQLKKAETAAKDILNKQTTILGQNTL